MGLLDALELGVAIANSVTKDAQPQVKYERYTVSTDGYGTEGFAAPVMLDAIIDWRQKQVRTPAGVLTVSRAAITLLDIEQVLAATEGKGIDDNDRFTLPDGTTGPILDMAGFISKKTGIPLATEVYIG